MRASLLSFMAVIGSASCVSAGPRRPDEVVTAWRSAAAIGDAETAARYCVPASGIWPGGGSPRPTLGPGGVAVETGRESRWRLGHAGSLVVTGAFDEPLLAGGVLGLTRASEPLEAVQLLARAWRERDFGLLVSLLPAEERASWTAESLARALRASPHAARFDALAGSAREGRLEMSWLEGGARARVESHAGVVVVSAEDDGWKVVDLQFGPELGGGP